MDESKNTPKEEKLAKESLKNVEKREKEVKPKKKHRALLIFGIIAAIIIAVPLLVAGWFGFIPGLSNLLGAKTPVDLGVKWSAADYESYLEKTNANFIDFSEAPVNPDDPSKKIVFADPVTVTNQTFTQEELTAAINSVGWAWMPISNAQVRLSQDTVEISGNLELENIENFVNFIGGVGYDDASVKTAADWGRRLAQGAPIYLKASTSVSNNQLDFSLQDVKIGRFSVPQDIANTVVFTGSTNSINNANNFSAESATFSEGLLNFSGQYPTTVYVLR